MQNQLKAPISPFTAQFRSAEMEEAFQNFVFTRNLRNNLWGLGVALFLYIAYVFIEPAGSAAPKATETIRILVFGGSAVLLSLFLLDPFRKRQDFITAIVVMLMGIGQDLMVWAQPDLNNTYYVGLIQGLILFGIVLRLNYASMAIPVSATFLMFVTIVFSKGESALAALQTANVFVVSLICIVGVYLMQRYQREDFFKTLTIEEQNKQLKVLLDDVQRDNERKLAALNLLVHFVKTPLHQINGFSDIVMNSLEGDDGRVSYEEGVESARYIKTATANLTKSVNGLLAYHRLDELERAREYERVDINDAVDEFRDLINEDILVSKDGEDGEIVTVAPAVKTAMNSLAQYYNETTHGISQIEIALVKEPFGMRIELRDDGDKISQDDFTNHTKPLTKIDSYLSSAGAEMPMQLRTVARAADLCGGDFRLNPCDGGNEFVITFGDKRRERPAAASAA
jgi:signal transduction histidine kinase